MVAVEDGSVRTRLETVFLTGRKRPLEGVGFDPGERRRLGRA